MKWKLPIAAVVVVAVAAAVAFNPRALSAAREAWGKIHGGEKTGESRAAEGAHAQGLYDAAHRGIRARREADAERQPKQAGVFCIFGNHGCEWAPCLRPQSWAASNRLEIEGCEWKNHSTHFEGVRSARFCAASLFIEEMNGSTLAVVSNAYRSA